MNGPTVLSAWAGDTFRAHVDDRDTSDRAPQWFVGPARDSQL
jgi:hypothetical protein